MTQLGAGYTHPPSTLTTARAEEEPTGSDAGYQKWFFAYAAIELVGITAGETAEPRKVVPKAVRAVIWRIAVFYVGWCTWPACC
ncbi:L-asparagine transporter-like permease [Catenulispora sp. GP43]|uniref:hypothetical protein n=1 Tax=Catenulispora sp. GP43 TaxID=3156263 RepID=UPI00351522E9